MELTSSIELYSKEILSTSNNNYTEVNDSKIEDDKMVNLEEIITEVIRDLGANKPICGILLKSQIIASELDNDHFSDWISQEQNGYPNANDLPKYRVLAAVVKADVQVPFGMYQNVTIPSGIFNHKEINECMNYARIIYSLSEIEDICETHKNGMLSCTMPAIAYGEVNKYVRGSVQRVWQEFPATSLLHIVNIFKSKLLDFFLQLNKQIKSGINFSEISSKENENIIKRIMNNTYNINAAIANTGEGCVNAGDVTASGLQMNPSGNLYQQMQSIVSQIENAVKAYDNADLKDALETLKEETAKVSWSKKAVRIAFNAINGIAYGITANQLTPLVTKGLALLA